MSTQFVERVAVEVDGDGDPVLMIHGLGGTSNVWTPLLPALTRFRTIRPDLPGSGRSSASRVTCRSSDSSRRCAGCAGRSGWSAHT